MTTQKKQGWIKDFRLKLKLEGRGSVANGVPPEQGVNKVFVVHM